MFSEMFRIVIFRHFFAVAECGGVALLLPASSRYAQNETDSLAQVRLDWRSPTAELRLTPILQLNSHELQASRLRLS
ncbi:hypothetical protein [Brasilonema sennae]|uniref:hypothetical protein n=1 Tax=Brasilonema sennae TaxID=1397703 RepID=UPI00155A3FED|nr:hypothetical protein [Brasilonema sennae]